MKLFILSMVIALCYIIGIVINPLVATSILLLNIMALGINIC